MHVVLSTLTLELSFKINKVKLCEEKEIIGSNLSPLGL